MGIRKLSDQKLTGAASGATHQLDDHSAPDDVTTLNATTSEHGLLKKLSNVSTEFMNGQGNWATPAGAAGGGGPGTSIPIFTGSFWMLNVQWQSASLGIGMVTGQQGTQLVSKALATTNLLLSQHANVRRPAAGAAVSHLYSGFPAFWRGNASGLGGFFFSARVGYNAADSAAARRFVGLSATFLGSITTFGVTFLNCCGFSREDTGESNWFFRHNDGSGSPTAVDTGMAAAAGTVYDMRIFCTPNASTISWEIDDVTNGTSQSGSISSDLPTSTLFMYAVLWMYKTAGSGAASLHIINAVCHSGGPVT